MKLVSKIIFLVLISFYSFSQNKNSVFESVDAKILNLPAYKSDDLDTLSELITKDFSTESEKVRAVYVWVANNISYNTEKYFAGRNRLSELSGEQVEGESAEEIISSRQAVCEGYSNLLKALCTKAGISCEVIEGIGRPENDADLHAWNAIDIDGEWKLLDVTWSAGAVNMKNKKYYKSFSDQFFLSAPAEFIKTHYPFDPMWQLLLHPVNRNEYEAKKIISGDITIFQYSDSINSYLQQDSISQLIAACRRTYEYDSRNKI
ncbi:MAG: transglutaminase domain-containing protein, partial [Bacteroidia bacterium]